MSAEELQRLLPDHPVWNVEATWQDLAKALAYEVLTWAETPGDHGQNPYTLAMVRYAEVVKDRTLT